MPSNPRNHQYPSSSVDETEYPQQAQPVPVPRRSPRSKAIASRLTPSFPLPLSVLFTITLLLLPRKPRDTLKCFTLQNQCWRIGFPLRAFISFILELRFCGTLYKVIQKNVDYPISSWRCPSIKYGNNIVVFAVCNYYFLSWICFFFKFTN